MSISSASLTSPHSWVIVLYHFLPSPLQPLQFRASVPVSQAHLQETNEISRRVSGKTVRGWDPWDFPSELIFKGTHQVVLTSWEPSSIPVPSPRLATKQQTPAFHTGAGGRFPSSLLFLFCCFLLGRSADSFLIWLENTTPSFFVLIFCLLFLTCTHNLWDQACGQARWK